MKRDAGDETWLFQENVSIITGDVIVSCSRTSGTMVLSIWDKRPVHWRCIVISCTGMVLVLDLLGVISIYIFLHRSNKAHTFQSEMFQWGRILIKCCVRIFSPQGLTLGLQESWIIIIDQWLVLACIFTLGTVGSLNTIQSFIHDMFMCFSSRSSTTWTSRTIAELWKLCTPAHSACPLRIRLPSCQERS